MPTTMQRFRQAAMALAAYSPDASDWPVPKAWPSVYLEFAPVQVVDLCGGVEGVTKWPDISEQCGTWAVNLLKCQQVCFQTASDGHFGKCMDSCSGGAPETSWCSKPEGVSSSVMSYCELFTSRWRKCKVSAKHWRDSHGWCKAIDKCVFNCTASEELEKELGEVIGWRYRKCPVKFNSTNSTNSSDRVAAFLSLRAREP
mmetsp:Transcript_71046/g.123214  ORF Transcript_71046/g.123214 Transcript_71046/m.123214 type:complete len:200 (-) Transcript_71046:73-672(-)